MGLAVSCAARSVDQAAGAIPLLLMPQLLLAGGLMPLAQMPGAVAGLANLAYARWSYAGLASAAHIGARLSAYDYSSALGFSSGFFSLAPATAAVILVGFTLLELFIAVVLLMQTAAGQRVGHAAPRTGPERAGRAVSLRAAGAERRRA